jgi:predicted ArsR family transcriptional regulator
MQETRRHILEILRRQEQLTVDAIVDMLRTRYAKGITAVTVRHHLNILQQEGLITEPELRHRNTPGRPQHVYMLTEKAQQVFPNNYQPLLAQLIQQLHNQLPSNGVNVIFDGVASGLAANMAELPPMTVNQRMDIVVEYLTELGYDAYWESSEQGFILHTRNCPYHHIAQNTDALCSMDLRLISLLVGSVPRRLCRVAEGENTCAYLISIN